MSISKVIRHFEGVGKVPVSIEDVLKQIQGIVLDEKIEIHGVDREATKLRGIHRRYHIPPHPDSALIPQRVVEIIYSTRQPLEWQRLVCCKEMVHIFDREPIWTRGKEEILKLAQNIADGRPQGSKSNNQQWFFDEIAKFQALAILFPFGLREEIVASNKLNDLNIGSISSAVQLPKEFVIIVMSEAWPLLRESLLASG